MAMATSRLSSSSSLSSTSDRRCSLDSTKSPTISEKGTGSTKSKETHKTEKICVVCGDGATGIHFAAMTCEGCKGFFRRSMKKEVQFLCAFDNNCTISRANRKHCQSCRLNKCLAVGMDASLIMSDESVNRKRELIRQNREKRALVRAKKVQQELEMQMKENKISRENSQIRMSMADKLLIETLLKGHNASYDFSYEEYDTFRGTEVIPAPVDVDRHPSDVTLAWLVASLNPKTSKSETSSDIAAKSEPLSPDGPFDENVATPQEMIPQEVLDIFSSLHGVPQTSPPPAEDQIMPPQFSASNNDAPSTSFKNYDSYKSEHLPTNIHLPEQPEVSSADSQIGMSDMHSNMGGGETASFLQSLLAKQGISLAFMQDEKTRHLLQHFCDIMTWGIKKVIEFCKSIPEFQEISTVDQINLLRGGCLEMLVLRSYFAFAAEGNKYMSDKFQYTPMDFLQAGASAEFVEMYGNVHERMRKMELKVEEICLLIALVLFSPDRPGLVEVKKIEEMQSRISTALRAYEFTHRPEREAIRTISEIILLMPLLRTINVLFSNTILTLKGTNEEDINPLILEVNP